MELLPIVILFGGLIALMYLQSKKQKRMAETIKQMQDSLVPGTRVMTTSGVYGTVTAVADDTIEVEIAPGVPTTWVRGAIREVVVADVESVDHDDAASVSLDKSDNKDVG